MAAVDKWQIPAYRICRVVEIVLDYVSRLTPTNSQTADLASDSSSYQPSEQSQASTLSEYLPVKDMKRQRQATPLVKQTTTDMITVNSNNPAQALKKGRSSRASDTDEWNNLQVEWSKFTLEEFPRMPVDCVWMSVLRNSPESFMRCVAHPELIMEEITVVMAEQMVESWPHDFILQSLHHRPRPEGGSQNDSSRG